MDGWAVISNGLAIGHNNVLEVPVEHITVSVLADDPEIVVSVKDTIEIEVK
jgi:hypothetical protein